MRAAKVRPSHDVRATPCSDGSQGPTVARDLDAAMCEPGSCEKEAPFTRRFGRLKACALQHNAETCAISEDYSPARSRAVCHSTPIGFGARRKQKTTRTTGRKPRTATAAPRRLESPP